MKFVQKFKKLMLLVVIILVIFAVYKYFSKSWKLSLYKDGETIMRLDYKTKEDCLSAGHSYEKTIDRFDCGYKCSDGDNLKVAPICKQVCNNSGCR